MKNKKNFLKKLFLLFFILIIIATLTALYAYYIGTTGIFVKEYKVKNSNITDNFYGFKIVQLSDIHYGRTVHKKELEKIVDKINATKPDIVILSGDLVDMDTVLDNKMINEIAGILSKIDVTINKYAILGNHDTMFDSWNNIIDSAGFVDLNDNYDLIYYKDNKNYIMLSGISSVANKKKSLTEKMENTDNYLKKLNKDDSPCYRILVIHEPDLLDDIDYKDYDLVLAGHTHKGQVVIPGIKPLFLPSYGKKYYKDYYKLKNTDVYISSGIGTSKLNFRLFNRPSFNLYRLTNK